MSARARGVVNTNFIVVTGKTFNVSNRYDTGCWQAIEMKSFVVEEIGRII